MRVARLVTVLIITPLLTSLVGHAARAEEPAQSFDALLERIDAERAAHGALDARREQAFLARRDRQQALIEQALAERDAAKARSDALSSRFDENERRIAEQEDQLKIRLGSLGELVGVVAQVSSDAFSVVYNSLVSAQYPGREDFLSSLSTTTELPTIDQLAGIAQSILKEAVETGRVRRFEGRVVESDGTEAEQEVIRIGPFMAFGDGRFLSYSPTLKRLSALPRQPGGEVMALADAFARKQEGYHAMPLDPSRGVLLDLYVQRPNVVERIEKGEAVGYVIIAVGLAGAFAALFQVAYLIRVRWSVSRQLRHLESPTLENPLGRVLASYRTGIADPEEEGELIELRVEEAVLRELPRLERFQPFLRLVVAAGPLLGLIGTVIGMILTFQSITESGSSDPRLMATGIGQAMIATVLGLGVAIPLLFANAGLASLSQGIVQILEEQSTGLLAGLLEQRRAAKARAATPDGGHDHA